MIDNLPPACQETRTWFNRNGTFLRVLIVVDEHSHIPRSLGDVDVNVQRLIDITAERRRSLLGRLAQTNEHEISEERLLIVEELYETERHLGQALLMQARP